MAERANPDLLGFKDKITFRWRKGFIPWFSVKKSPYRAALLWRYNWVKKYCRGQDVLDIPCGMGWGTSKLQGCRSLIGIDISSEAIQEAKQRYGSQAKFLVGDMKALDFPDSSFDLVACIEGIEHVPCDIGQAFLQEAHRVLRPGGRLFLSSPYCKTGKHSGNPFHIHEYRPEEIHELIISQNFEIDAVYIREVDNLIVNYIQASKKS